MSRIRIPFIVDIDTRDGSLEKDAKIMNGYKEAISKEEQYVVKRPGVSISATLPMTTGQVIFEFQNGLYTVIGNELYSITGSTYTLIGSLLLNGIPSSNFFQCYTTQSLPA